MGRFVLCAAFAAMGAVIACTSPVQNGKRATVLGAYELALDECIARGRKANSYAVYEACADDADQRFGVTKDAGVDR